MLLIPTRVEHTQLRYLSNGNALPTVQNFSWRHHEVCERVRKAVTQTLIHMLRQHRKKQSRWCREGTHKYVGELGVAERALLLLLYQRQAKPMYVVA